MVHIQTMSPRTHLLAVLAVAAIVFAPSVAHASPNDGATKATSTPALVKVPVSMIDTPGRTGSNGIVKLRIGNAAPISVMVDTGSVGLRLWSAPASVANSAKKSVQVSVGGSTQSARLGSARMTLGSVTTSTAVPYAVIDAQSAYIDQWKQVGVSGIIGIGIGPSPGTGQLQNPLASLPDGLGKRWSLHFGQPAFLILGARPPADAQMYFPLQPAGTNANGALLWNDRAAPGCWRFGATAVRCVPTVFDSGFTVMRISGRAFDRLPTTATDQLSPGTRVALSAASAAFVGDMFRAGDVESRNFARVIPKGTSSVNTGNSYFFRYTVTYNTSTGDIYLSHPQRKAATND
jgi:hypothetical protein